MKKITLLLIYIVISLPANALVQAAPPTKATPVTTTVEDFDSTTGLTYRLQSDSFSTAANPLGLYKGGVDSVITEIQPAGDWVLDLNSSTTRKVYLSFDDPVPYSESGQIASAPFANYQLVTARIISKCSENGILMQNLTPNSAPALCPFSIAFTYGGSSYGFRMNTNNFPQTEFAQWICLAQNSSTGKCNSWRAEPSVIQADGQRKIKGQLIKLASSRKETDQLIGMFYMSFAINATNP